jgi:hypothetical protein
MNSGGWQIFLALFIIGACAQFINQVGIWNVSEANQQFALNGTEITTYTSQSANSTLSIFVIYQWIVTFVQIIASGLVAELSLGVLFYAMGWPVGVLGAALLTLIQAPATLVSLYWVFEVLTGH